MAIGIAIFIALALGAFAALFMARKPPPVVEPEAPPPVRRRRPARYALPPVTIETIPPAGLVPPIDRNVFAALAVPRPEPFARGSIPPSHDDLAHDLDDDSETHRAGSDLDNDAVTRVNMQPVA